MSALVGIACARWVGGPELAAALAVGAAVAGMFALRCLHPPGGATALLMVLTGVTAPSFALYPVLVNSVLLVAAVLFGRALSRAELFDTGWSMDEVMVGSFDLTLDGTDAAAGAAFYRELTERASSIPGVTASSLATSAA